MGDTIAEWAYVAACLLVPAAWGALSAWLFSLRDRRRGGQAEGPRQPPVDYVI